jgi:hypothetical protein
MRNNWLALTSVEQHVEYRNYVTMLKQHHERINKISSSVHAKLGHRKKWIHAACETQGVAPTKKKDKSNEFIWAQNFFKLDLTKVNLSIALVFAPSHFLTEDKYDTISILDKIFDNSEHVLGASDFTDELCGVTAGLWKEWAIRFSPDAESFSLVEVPPAETLKDDNPFQSLPEAEA